MDECGLRPGWDWFNGNEVQRVDEPEIDGMAVDPLFANDQEAVDHIRCCATCAHDLLKLAVPQHFGPPPQITYEVEVEFMVPMLMRVRVLATDPIEAATVAELDVIRSRKVMHGAATAKSCRRVEEGE